MLEPKTLVDVTDSTHNIRTRIYSLNKLIMVSIYSTDITGNIPVGHYNYALAMGAPKPIEEVNQMVITNREDLFTINITENGYVRIGYVYSYKAQSYIQISQNITYFAK